MDYKTNGDQTNLFMTTDQDLVSMCWQDALDDGSLTLRAEHFLLRLPYEVVPAATCLFFPDLINQLASRIPPSMTPGHPSYFKEVFVQTNFMLTAIPHSLQRQLEFTHSEIVQEWLVLRNWLAQEVGTPPSNDPSAPLPRLVEAESPTLRTILLSA